MHCSRRQFVMTLTAAGGAVVAGRGAAAPAALDPKDPQALAMGYTSDAARIAPAFAARRAADAHCGNCALFQGKAADAPGACPLFGGKTVQAQGWCGSWVGKG